MTHRRDALEGVSQGVMLLPLGWRHLVDQARVKVALGCDHLFLLCHALLQALQLRKHAVDRASLPAEWST